MLGNFSIGDYFKDDAIRFGWELSTEVFGLDPERIWITVFEGMEGVPADDEAIEHWVEMGVPRERIQALGESENFWKAGPTGPCGPNTELYLDRGPAFGPEGGPRRRAATATWSTGTWSSCSTTARPTARCRRCRRRTSTPAPAWSASPPCSRTCRRSSTPTPSGR